MVRLPPGVLLLCALCPLRAAVDGPSEADLADPEASEQDAEDGYCSLLQRGTGLKQLPVGRDSRPSLLQELRREDWPMVNLSLLATSPRRRCGADACESTADAPVGSGPRRTYVFIMGVEGAGHHALCPLLQSLLQRWGYKVEVAHINMFGREKIMAYSKWKAKFLEETDSWCPDGVCLNCLDSFPYERPIEASAAPDFPRMASLHEEGLIDLRVVSILRNISDSVFSAMRRFPSDPVQAVASTRQFLMEVVRNTEAWSRLHCERLSTVRYEQLVKDARKVMPGLVRALGLDKSQGAGDHLSQAISVAEAYQSKTLHASHEQSYQEGRRYETVSSWLREREDFLWPEMDELWCQ